MRTFNLSHSIQMINLAFASCLKFIENKTVIKGITIQPSATSCGPLRYKIFATVAAVTITDKGPRQEKTLLLDAKKKNGEFG